MKGDYSRFSFDKNKRYSAVLMQQGRLQLDSDWNEQVQISEHRNTAFFRNLVGRSGAPAGNAMNLVLKNGVPTLTEGVCYIDGLFVENDRDIALSKEERPQEDGEYLYYLDAWTREVNASEDEALVDPAIGVDTTTRLKTEWKLRWKKVSGANWKEIFSAGRWPQVGAEGLPEELANSTWWWPTSTGRMSLKSLTAKVDDNRLYRVEIHESTAATTRFKWSRDNAFVCAEVRACSGGYALANDSVPMQDAFKDAAWIELCTPEEAGVLLDMRKEGRKAEFESGVLNPGTEYSEVLSSLKGAGKLIIRRWDGVYEKGEKENSLEAELGAIRLKHSEGFYRSGDYWLLLLRGKDILNWETGKPTPPEGVAHHFAGLASVGIRGGAWNLELLQLQFNPLTSPNLTVESELAVEKLTVRGASELRGPLSLVGNFQGMRGSFSALENPMELLFLGVTPQSLAFDSGVADKKTVQLFSKTSWEPSSNAISWTASSNVSWCTVTPPDGSGNATVTVNVTENTSDFGRTAVVTFQAGSQLRKLNVTQPALLAPIISGFMPSAARHGMPLTLFGGNFSPTPANNVVKLNGIEAVVMAATTTQLTVTVPKDRTCSGRITVAVGGKTATSHAVFDYTDTVTVETFVGAGRPGAANSQGRNALFNGPYDVVIDPSGSNLYVADEFNHCIRSVTIPGGMVDTFAGSLGASGSVNGSRTVARFHGPQGIAITPSGDHLYVADTGNHCIRRLTIPKQPGEGTQVTTFAGTAGKAGFADGSGQQSLSPAMVSPLRLAGQAVKPPLPPAPATIQSSALFNSPGDIAINAEGTALFVADYGNHRIRKVEIPSGRVSTLAGSGTAGFSDHPTGIEARFRHPWGIIIDASGDLIVVDRDNHCIRKVTQSGLVTTFAGSPALGHVDGMGMAAQFHFPRSIVLDRRSGNFYVTVPAQQERIRKITPQGMVSTIAGSTAGYRDGPGATALLNGPLGIAIDASSTLYVVEHRNHCIRKIVLE